MPDEEHHTDVAPSVEALIAGTVALMTLWADPAADASLDPAAQRSALAHKVVSNLFILTTHAGLSEGLRLVMGKAYQRWIGLAESMTFDAEPARAGIRALH